VVLIGLFKGKVEKLSPGQSRSGRFWQAQIAVTITTRQRDNTTSQGLKDRPDILSAQKIESALRGYFIAGDQS
jgi:hypothetical protein